MDSANSITTWFVADVVGDYTIQLTVYDGHEYSSDSRLITATSEETVPGDLDGDGDVDNDDYLYFRSAYGSCEGDSNFLVKADLDKDGCVTINDYRLFRDLM